MIKKILLGLLGVVILLIIIGFFLPGKMEMSKSIVVNAPAEYAFEEINELQNWNKWSYWNSLDPTMKVTYNETPSGTGASYSWESEDMGNGKLNITESVPNSSIKADLDFIEQGTAKAWYNFEPEGEGTKVTMGFSTEFGMNPIGRWMAVFMKPEMNKAFDYNLNKIKEIAEAKPKFTVKITQEDVAPVSYVGLSAKMSPQDMNAVSKQMEKMYTELYGAMQKSKVQIAGSPFCIYPSYSKESMEMVCSVPVPANAKIPGKYKLMQTQGGKAIKAVHAGAYTKLDETYNQLDEYIKFKKLEINGAPWEVYITDPTVEKDTTKWITEVYYPIKGE